MSRAGAQISTTYQDFITPSEYVMLVSTFYHKSLGLLVGAYFSTFFSLHSTPPATISINYLNAFQEALSSNFSLHFQPEEL